MAIEPDDTPSASEATRAGVNAGAALCVIIILLGALAVLSVLIDYGFLPLP